MPSYIHCVRSQPVLVKAENISIEKDTDAWKVFVRTYAEKQPGCPLPQMLEDPQVRRMRQAPISGTGSSEEHPHVEGVRV